MATPPSNADQSNAKEEIMLTMWVTQTDCVLPCGCWVKKDSLMRETTEKVRGMVQWCGDAEHNNHCVRACIALEQEKFVEWTDDPEGNEHMRYVMGPGFQIARRALHRLILTL